jgi:general secretion pathway protein I
MNRTFSSTVIERPSYAFRLRRGLSLLEVLLALAILGGSLAAIGELMRIGARSAEASRDQTTAQLLGETVMSQIAAGLLPPQAVSSAQIDDPMFQLEWSYSIVIEQVDQQGLIAVWVTIQQSADVAARPVAYTLARWMIDPEFLAETVI